jgi:CRP-like cAMP-binding protein
MVATDYPLTRLFLRGRLRHAMSLDEKALLESLIEGTVRLPAGHVILARGAVTERSTLLLDGFIARVIRDGGKRHIVGFQVPGDFVDLHGFALKRLDHDVVAMGPVRIGYSSHARIEVLMAEAPHLTRLLWFSTLLDAAIHREWILKLEELKADERLAHVIVELWHRLEFVDLADPHGFNMPMMQLDLADACGTTAVHINRVIRALREAGLLEISRGRVTIPDMSELARYASFTPDYLYGSGDLRVVSELDAPQLRALEGGRQG